MTDRPVRVLVAEDDRLLRTAALTALRRAGCEVLAAEDGEQAVARAAERPDLILLDLVMPRMDGFEALARLQDDPATRDIPVIVLSNLGSDSDRARAAGAAGFYVKASLSLAQLVAEVRRALAANGAG